MEGTGRRCEVHQLALDPEGRCILCRRTSAPPHSAFGPRSSAPAISEGARAGVGRTPWLLGGFLLVLCAGAIGWFSGRQPPRPAGEAALGAAEDQPQNQDPGAKATDAPKDQPSRVLEGSLSSQNRSNRSGAYFIPDGASLPLLVILHGSGGNGSGAVQAFRSAALRQKFAIVAPESGFIPEAGMYTWYVAKKAGDPSADSEHIARCIDEVVTLAAGRITSSGWLAVGHSGGASSAPYLATHDARFVAFGVLHGGAFPDAFGPLRPRGWFSTGDSDPARTPAHVGDVARAAAAVLGSARTESHVFHGGHELLPDEIEGVIAFWFAAVRL